MNANERRERELESFLAEENSRVAALYRKLPRHEPDAKLDASVLAMARNAVAPRRSRNRWLPALSAAAVVLVVAGVAYRAGPQVWKDRGALTPPPTSNTIDEANPAAVAPPASPPAAASSQPQESAPGETANLDVNTAKSVSAPAQPAPADALARRKVAEAPRPQSPPPSRETVAQPQAAAVETEEKRLDKSAAPPPPPPPARDAPLQSFDSAIFPSEETQKQEVRAETSGAVRADVAPGRPKPVSGAAKAAPEPFSAPAPATAFAPAQRATKQVAPNNQLYPEHWISNIQKMLRENRRDEAIRNLDEFRKQYPDYRLPDDLRELK